MKLIALSEEGSELYEIQEGRGVCYLEIRDLPYRVQCQSDDSYEIDPPEQTGHIYAPDAHNYDLYTNWYSQRDIQRTVGEANASFQAFDINIPSHYKDFSFSLREGRRTAGEIYQRFLRRVPLNDLRSLTNGSLGEQGAALVMGASNLLSDPQAHEYWTTWASRFSPEELASRVVEYFKLIEIGKWSNSCNQDKRFPRDPAKRIPQGEHPYQPEHYVVGNEVFYLIFPSHHRKKGCPKEVYQNNLAYWNRSYKDMNFGSSKSFQDLALYLDHIAGFAVRLQRTILFA